MLSAGENQSFFEKLRESDGGVQAPKLAYAFVVYAGYCVAAQLDRALTIQPGVISALSLADALLIVALLGPPRMWWLVLAGALPAHLIQDLANDGSALVGLGDFAGNFTAALVSVALLRRLSLWPPRFQNARDVIIFILSGCALPSLIGASLQLIIHSGEGRGTLAALWSIRFLSRVASIALAVPVVAMAVNWMKEERRISWQRFVEGAALCLGTLMSSCAAFGFSTTRAGAGWALGGIVLSCLIWAAVRFGVGGTGACLLLMGLCAGGFASHDRGVFGYADPIDTAMALDVFLVTISVPLLVLAALLRAREVESSGDIRRVAARFEKEVSPAAERGQRANGRQAREDFRARLSEQAGALGHLEKCLKEAGISEPPLRELERLQEEAVALEKEFKLLMAGLQSAETQGKGFEDVLREFCREFGASSNLRVEISFERGTRRISTDVAWCCFRVMQEGLRHAARDARASEAQIKIAAGADRLFLALAENGTESAPAKAMESWAEANRMKLSVESLSGEFRIARRETRGTLLMVVLPI